MISQVAKLGNRDPEIHFGSKTDVWGCFSDLLKQENTSGYRSKPQWVHVIHVLTVLVPLPWGPFSPPLYRPRGIPTTKAQLGLDQIGLLRIADRSALGNRCS